MVLHRCTTTSSSCERFAGDAVWWSTEDMGGRVAYWRMQLHPDSHSHAAQYAVTSLAAGFIGLDFGVDPGDLSRVPRTDLAPGQTDFHDFAHAMTKGDLVLVIVHHHPFALATVDGEYNYIKSPEPELGIWFRHFRRVRDVKYYADRVTNPRDWEKLVMADTISALQPTTLSAQLISGW